MGQAADSQRADEAASHLGARSSVGRGAEDLGIATDRRASRDESLPRGPVRRRTMLTSCPNHIAAFVERAGTGARGTGSGGGSEGGAVMRRALTTQAWWEAYWEDLTLPCEVKRRPELASLNRILDALDRFLPHDPNLSILEIGGAPGQYLAYFYRSHGYKATVLDYSDVGCRKSRENLRLLGVPATVVQGDLFAPRPNLGTFDIVYSLGFVEHFSDLLLTIRHHVALARPGGLLLVGVPNFLGVNGFFLRRLAPGLVSKHNLSVMDQRSWDHFERVLGLTRLFREYVGGFEPSVFCKLERSTPLGLGLYGTARILKRLCRGATFKAFNSILFSHYLLGVYRVPGDRKE